MITIKDEEILFDLADLFKVFGDSTRLRIMNVLLVDLLVYAKLQKSWI